MKKIFNTKNTKRNEKKNKCNQKDNNSDNGIFVYNAIYVVKIITIINRGPRKVDRAKENIWTEKKTASVSSLRSLRSLRLKNYFGGFYPRYRSVPTVSEI